MDSGRLASSVSPGGLEASHSRWKRKVWMLVLWNRFLPILLSGRAASKPSASTVSFNPLPKSFSSLAESWRTEFCLICNSWGIHMEPVTAWGRTAFCRQYFKSSNFFLLLAWAAGRHQGPGKQCLRKKGSRLQSRRSAEPASPRARARGRSHSALRHSHVKPSYRLGISCTTCKTGS